jgi:DNA-binding NarL/FixJ family response regulator
MNINERTVQNHKLRILEKLNPEGGKTLTQLLLIITK